MGLSHEARFLMRYAPYFQEKGTRTKTGFAPALLFKVQVLRSVGQILCGVKISGRDVLPDFRERLQVCRPMQIFFNVVNLLF